MTSHARTRSLLGGAGFLAGFWLLQGPAADALPGPADLTLGELLTWLQQAQPEVVAATALRWLALAFGWYCVLTTALAVGARLSRRRNLIAAVDRLCLASVRTVATSIAGAALTAATVASAGAQQTIPAAAPTMHQLATASTTVAPEPAPTFHQRVPDSPRFRLAPAETELPPEPAEAQPVAKGTPAPPTSTWTVQAGDHLWSIAERVLERNGLAEPDVPAIHSYWQRLVAANRANLADPANADLLMIGQAIDLPALG